MKILSPKHTHFQKQWTQLYSALVKMFRSAMLKINQHMIIGEKIRNKCVRMFIGERMDGCQVYLRLPERVDRVIIFQFGQAVPFCYAENQGRQVYPGENLKNRDNPFTFNKQLTRLSDLRKRLKFLY